MRKSPTPTLRSIGKWLRIAELIALAPLMVAALPGIVAAIAIYIVVALPVLIPIQMARMRRRARRLRRAMAAAGRTTTWAEVEASIASGRGVLISAESDAGCALWFAGENIRDLDHPPLPDWNSWEPDEAFSQWCTARYTDPGTGRGLLLEQPARRRGLRALDARILRLQQEHPSLDYIALEWFGPHSCRKCDYPRQGLDVGPCPECGHPCPARIA